MERNLTNKAAAISTIEATDAAAINTTEATEAPIHTTEAASAINTTEATEAPIHTTKAANPGLHAIVSLDNSKNLIDDKLDWLRRMDDIDKPTVQYLQKQVHELHQTVLDFQEELLGKEQAMLTINPNHNSERSSSGYVDSGISSNCNHNITKNGRGRCSGCCLQR